MSSQFTYIPDGHYFRAKIAAVDGLHGEIEFFYRPMLRSEHVALTEEMRRANDPKKQSESEAADLAGRILRWSIPVAVSVAGLDSVPLALYRRMLNIVWGVEPATSLTTMPKDEIEKLDEDAAAKN